MRRLVKYGVVILGLVILITAGLLIQLGPSSNKVFSGIFPVTCIYQIKVIAFEDLNGDGVQNSGEPGIADTKVSLQHSLPMSTPMPEQTSTDSTGLASLNRNEYCLPQDTLMVNISPSSGFNVISSPSFGPYTVPEFTNDSRPLAVEHPIPNVLYVGLRRKP